MSDPAHIADTVPETRARRRIRLAVEAKGYKLTHLEWEPWGASAEKSGIPGGWYGEVEPKYQEWGFPGNEIMGLSVDEVLDWIERLVPTRFDGDPS